MQTAISSDLSAPLSINIWRIFTCLFVFATRNPQTQWSYNIQSYRCMNGCRPCSTPTDNFLSRQWLHLEALVKLQTGGKRLQLLFKLWQHTRGSFFCVLGGADAESHLSYRFETCCLVLLLFQWSFPWDGVFLAATPGANFAACSGIAVCIDVLVLSWCHLPGLMIFRTLPYESDGFSHVWVWTCGEVLAQGPSWATEHPGLVNVTDEQLGNLLPVGIFGDDAGVYKHEKMLVLLANFVLVSGPSKSTKFLITVSANY